MDSSDGDDLRREADAAVSEYSIQFDRRRTGTFLAILVLGVGLVGIGAVVFPVSKLIAAGVMAAGMFFVRVASLLSGKRPIPAQIRIGPEEIVVVEARRENELTRVQRREITSGGFLPERRGGSVILLGERGEERLSLRVAEADDATHLLEELGLDATAHRSTFEGVYPMRSRARVALLLGSLGAGAAAFFAGLGPLPFLVMVVGIAALFAWPTSIEIASDGVVVRTLFGSRYVRYRDVAAIEKEERGAIAACLRLRDGTLVAVPSVSKAGARGDAALERNALMLERMHNAWIARRGGGGVAEGDQASETVTSPRRSP